MQKFHYACGIAAAGVLALGTSISAASASSLSDFYQHKKITVYVGSGPGGGYDTYARMMARHMGQYIPGHPGFIVKNMEGAGSIVAANFVYGVAPQDGSVIGALQRNAPIVQIMGQKGPSFKAVKFNWLGSFNNEVGIIAVAKRTGIKSLNDVFTKTVTMGTTGPNDTEFYPALLDNTLGTKFKLIKGYPSTPPVHLAIERGEVDGICQSWASFEHQSNLYREGKIQLLAQVSLKGVPELTKQGVPLLMDFIKANRIRNGMSVDEVRTVYRLLLATKTMGRPYVLGPKVPAAKVKALRTAFNKTAFDKTADDKGFLAEAKKSKRDVSLVTGPEIQGIVEKMAAAPKSVLNKIQDLTKYQGTMAVAKVSIPKFTGKVTQIKRGGRRIYINYKGKDIMAKVSGHRTKVTIGGKKTKRSKVKVGMTCTFEYIKPNTEAISVACK